MAIPARQIVDVTPRVINAGVPDLAMSGLLLTKNPLCIFPDMSFSSATAVGAYFGYDSDEYKAALKYFMGYDNAFKRPDTLKFARRIDVAVAGELIGGSAASLNALKTITNGSFDIDVDGTTVNVTGLDLSSATTQSNVATALATKIGATVAYNSNINAFIVTSATTGADSAISVATETASSTLLGLTSAKGAVAQDGKAAMSEDANMTAIATADGNWVSFTTLYTADASEIEALSKWCNDQKVEYAYFPYTNADGDTVPSNPNNLPNTLKTADYEGTVLMFGTIDHAVAAMAIWASVDWNRYNGLPTMAFRSQNGLAASVTDETVAENLLSMNVNYYGRYASRVEDFTFFYNGKLTGGDFGFIDAYIGNIWLRNALQNAILNGLQQVARTPYTDAGYNQIRAWCLDPINRGLNNGVIQAGLNLSEAQKAQLYNEIGIDVSEQLYTDGYFLLVADPGAQARVERETPVCGLWYTYGGAVQKIELPATVIL
jgi:hypothetical protein